MRCFAYAQHDKNPFGTFVVPSVVLLSFRALYYCHSERSEESLKTEPFLSDAFGLYVAAALIIT